MSLNIEREIKNSGLGITAQSPDELLRIQRRARIIEMVSAELKPSEVEDIKPGNGESTPKEEKQRSFGGVKPMGHLEETLILYEAPKNVQKRIARRAGGLIGHGISSEHVETVIQDSMLLKGDGIPKWDVVESTLSAEVHNLYHTSEHTNGHSNGNGNKNGNGVK